MLTEHCCIKPARVMTSIASCPLHGLWRRSAAILLVGPGKHGRPAVLTVSACKYWLSLYYDFCGQTESRMVLVGAPIFGWFFGQIEQVLHLPFHVFSMELCLYVNDHFLSDDLHLSKCLIIVSFTLGETEQECDVYAEPLGVPGWTLWSCWFLPVMV